MKITIFLGVKVKPRNISGQSASNAVFCMQPVVCTSESLINIPPFKNIFLKYVLFCVVRNRRKVEHDF